MDTIAIALAPLLLGAQTLAAGMPAQPHAGQAAIVTALERYAELSPRLPSVTLAVPNEFEGATKIPAWLADIPMTQQEAAALIAVTSAYRAGPVVSGTGPAQTYTRRKRNILEYVAGAAVSAAAADAARKSGADGPRPLGLSDGPRSATLGGAPTYYGNSTPHAAAIAAAMEKRSKSVTGWLKIRRKGWAVLGRRWLLPPRKQAGFCAFQNSSRRR